ncbi:DUF3857 domain-containing protein [Chryseobacterium sp. JJR-5R]|uniref:DUF3857 domain-containing protein n=1 Tax=Chryseobacterium sp. JJR-5R TaxID=3093923 RepID=UPI002A754924|nr:DUF3857 domain-containing protein [Chryseobacterium sp. JJR-5R]WPO83980.1 DUF3857 domain-containing protein [Chryseobacterium sp. JJR-5R]
MMKTLHRLSLISVLIVNVCLSQEHKFLVYPKFDEADLKKTHSLIEKDAPAEILYNSVRYNIKDISCEKTVYSKIKIYDKKRCDEWLNIEIPVMSGEMMSDFEVNVYNYPDNKIDKVTINKKDQLKENVVKGLKFYKLAIPNVKDGSVIEYSYKVTTGIFNVTHYLQQNIPVVYQEYNLEYPDSITYIFNTTGNNFKPRYHVSTLEDRLGMGYNIFRFGYENMKSSGKELFVKNSDRYRARIKPEVKRYATKYFTYDTAENWNKVSERLYDNENFGGFLKSNVKDVIPENIKNFYDPLERANKIFDFVKANYKWNRQYGVITSQNSRQLIKLKSGNSADVNLFLAALLRNAGLKADPLLISTVDNGILNITTPNINNLNHVIVSVNINNQIYFYDATSFNSKVNMLPERDWNDFGILTEKGKGTDLSFSNTNTSKKDLFIKANLDVENTEIKGNFTQITNGLYAIESYDEYDLNKDKYNQAFKTDFGTDVKEVNSRLLDNGDFESQMKFSSNTLIDVIGSKIILNPLLFLTVGNEQFDQTEERKNQIDFISAFTREKRVEITIPDGYKVSDLPKPKKIVTDDKEISYTYKVHFADNKITVLSKVDVLSQNYPKEYYPFFKQIWKIISDSENQVISLIKN